jgi:hypothetical protein
LKFAVDEPASTNEKVGTLILLMTIEVRHVAEMMIRSPVSTQNGPQLVLYMFLDWFSRSFGIE